MCVCVCVYMHAIVVHFKQMVLPVCQQWNNADVLQDKQRPLHEQDRLFVGMTKIVSRKLPAT